MKKSLFLLIVLPIILGCTNGNRFDPTQSKDGFRGITHTNSAGELIGRIDPNDWHIYGGDSYFYSSYKPAPSVKVGAINKTIIVPSELHVNPAYPNPTDDAFTLEFNLSYTSDWHLIIINDHMTAIDTISGHSDAGRVNVTYSSSREDGIIIQNGIYRIIYDLGGCSGYGDIWLK
jgi:hypothetical protein